jgi:riboflavin synthase
MFTGLITDLGTIDRVSDTAAGREFRVQTAFRDLVEGESVALNGACLTVRERGDGWFTVAAVVTTLDRTTIANWTVGMRVNLERALALGDRLGGHVARREDAWLIDIQLPATLMPLMVPHGSICVDGVSLTVNALRAADRVQLSIIEFTIRFTTLGSLGVGDRVHVEADVIGKYVQRLVAPHIAAAAE